MFTKGERLWLMVDCIKVYVIFHEYGSGGVCTVEYLQTLVQIMCFRLNRD